MSYVLKIVGLVAEPTRWTPWNDTYLMDCYPGRGSAQQLDVGFTSSPNIAEAALYDTAADALAERYLINPQFPWRWNGLPNYPLAPYVLTTEVIAAARSSRPPRRPLPVEADNA